MNREKIVEAIVAKILKNEPAAQAEQVRHSLKYIVSDMSLLSLAIDLGVNPDEVLAPAVR